jgi:hypothetical protein
VKRNRDFWISYGAFAVIALYMVLGLLSGWYLAPR